MEKIYTKNDLKEAKEEGFNDRRVFEKTLEKLSFMLRESQVFNTEEKIKKGLKKIEEDYFLLISLAEKYDEQTNGINNTYKITKRHFSEILEDMKKKGYWRK